MKSLLVTVLVMLTLVASASGQIVVSDPGNLAQTVLIADRTLREYETLVEQYHAIVRMAQNLGSLDRYRMPTIGITVHDPSRWLYGTPWLQALNTGDAGGALYRQVSRPLQRPGTALDGLPPDAQRAIQNSYATIELTDSIAEIAGHQVALVRGYSDRLQQLTQALESDILNPSSRYHEMTAVLDKVAAGELLGRRQDMATNQLLSHALEQLLARSKRMRDTEAATMNMRLLGMRDGRTAGTNLIAGAADDLRAWRLP